MVADNSVLLQHALDITFFGLPATASVRIDFPIAAGAEIPMSTSSPAVRLGASYSGAAMTVSSFSLTPRRLQFDLENAPASLPLLLHIESRSAFVQGWLQVPEDVQTLIVTAAQRIRFVGPGYWAVPLIQPERHSAAPKPTPAPRPAQAAAPSRSSRSSRSRQTPAPRPAARPTPAPTPTPPPAT
jgi:hypothetical protein